MKRSAVHSINNKSIDGAADIKFQNTPKIVNYQSRSSLLIERSSGAATEIFTRFSLWFGTETRDTIQELMSD